MKVLDQVHALCRRRDYSLRPEPTHCCGVVRYVRFCATGAQGLRLSEALRVRVKDLDFEGDRLDVRGGKGGKDHVVMLPILLRDPLRRQFRKAKAFHEEDLEAGYGRIHLPKALARKYPSAPEEWVWQWVFPSTQRSWDPCSGQTRRHHRSASAVQELLGHESLDTTMIYTHVAGGAGAESPLDSLENG